MTERSAGSPAATIRVLPPLPSTLTVSASKSIDSRSRSTSSSARSPQAYANSNNARSRISSGVVAGMRFSSAATSSALRVRGSRCAASEPAAGPRGSLASRRVRPSTCRTNGSPRACGRRCAARATSGELGGVAAQHGVVDGVGLDAAGAAPERELGEVDAVGAARALGGAAALELAVEGAQRGAPRVGRTASLGPDGLVLHRHRHGSGRHPAPARRGGADPAPPASPSCRGSRSRGRAMRPPSGTP